MGEAVEAVAFPVVTETSDIMEKADYSDPSVPVKGFWRLPPEIRNAIYEELLVTDCAFRLGYACMREEGTWNYGRLTWK